MCDFPSDDQIAVTDYTGLPPGQDETCPTCFEASLQNRPRAPDGCGLASCVGTTPVAPCGSETCVYKNTDTWPPCSEDICPHTPTPLIDCKREDGTRCNAYGEPTCLTDSSFKFGNFADRFKLTNFSKYTFNKDKYLPKSYLPGDGADFLIGYNTKLDPNDIDAGKCGSKQCATKLDDLLMQLKQPLFPVGGYSSNYMSNGPRFSQKANPYVDYCEGPDSYFGTKMQRENRPSGCGRLDSTFETKMRRESKPSTYGRLDSTFGTKIESRHDNLTEYGSPDCPQKIGNKIQDKEDKLMGCGAPDCYFETKKQTRKDVPTGCGAPDCKYGSGKPQKGCGSPDCKFSLKSDSLDCDCVGKKDDGGSCHPSTCHYNKSESSELSCGNPECPFARKAPVECHDKNCPYAKELIICQDCGGVIVEGVEVEPIVEQPPPPETAVFESPAVTTSVEIEKVKLPTEKELKAEATKGERERRISPERKTRGAGEPKQTKRKKEVLFKYPGTVLGHHDCQKKLKNIPANMGWLWNIKPAVGNPELWRGYKPGAISKTVHKIIRKHRRALGILDPSDIMRKRRSKTSTRALSDKNKRVISLRKKEGNYVVTLTPVKDPSQRTANESPFIDCTPVQFRINKLAKPKVEDGCNCDLNIEEENDSESDLSELDVNFSPPAAIPIKPYSKKKVKVTKDTQYILSDIQPQKSKTPTHAKPEKTGKKKGKKKVKF